MWEPVLSLQDRNLWMLALGTSGDAPPNQIQPPLRDGMHLRWLFDPAKGVPWYGYYLFRRPARDERKRRCLASRLRGQEPGASIGSSLPLGWGELHSNRPLAFTDDFPQAGVPELNLADRENVTLTLAASAAPAHDAEVTIGFRGDGRRPASRECIEFKGLRPRPVRNPLRAHGATLVTLEDERPREKGQIVETESGTGWDCGSNAEIALPCRASRVYAVLAYEGEPPVVEALDSRGEVIDAGRPSSSPDRVALGGDGIVSLRIDSREGRAVLLELCWVCKGGPKKSGASVRVSARYAGAEVASVTASGNPGDVKTVTLTADAFDEVVVGPGEAALIDLCVTSVRDSLGGGWKELRDLTYPICLPVSHSDYPCPDAPASQPDAEALALDRVAYGPESDWAGTPFADMHDRLERLVEGGPPPGGLDMASRSEPMAGSPAPPPAAGGAIAQPRQRPLDLLLIASLHPAIAEMLGFAAFDATAHAGNTYDYLLLADHDGSLGGSAASALAWLATAADFSVVDGFVCFGVTVEPQPALSPPSGARAYALPGATVAPSGGGAVLDATNNAGLVWDRQENGAALDAGAPVMYHVWRADAGDADVAATPVDDEFALVTQKGPLPVARPSLNPPAVPPRPDDWPPFPLHYIDRALSDGWYAYRVSAIDIFGRHSANGASAEWHQWSPEPAPRPWYYVDPAADRVLDPAAVRLLDKLPPPPPAGVEAFALDPADPTVLKDAAWQAWHASLSAAEQQSIVGLRVRWRWDRQQQRQAPDTREFRIYNTAGPANTLRGRVTSVAAAAAGETTVVTDIPNAQPAGSFAGTSVRVGAVSFSVLGSEAGSPLTLRVANVGPADDVAPATNSRCAVPIPPASPLFRALGSQGAWDTRVLTVGYGEHVSVDGAGNRFYELLLPVAGSANRSGLPLATTLEEPVAAGHVGVTAADDKHHTADARGDPARFGNESAVGGPAAVLRVRRVPPPAPPVLPDSPKVFASPADYRGESRYTLRWTPAAHLKTFVYRALDDAVFRADLAMRPRAAISDADAQLFPPDWVALRRQQAVTELNGLNSSPSLEKYAALSNDALRVLAALPGMERVFMQINPQPLDPDEPDPAAPGGLRWRRAGPDVAQSALGAGERAWVDVLDGRAVNRWFYRSAYVDEVYNVGPLSLASPPVWLPDVTPPRAPVIARVQGGERVVSIEWASNREPDLAEYRVYRTDDPAAARDVRLMTLVHTQAVAAGDPAARPASVTWADDPVPGLVTFTYRLAAVDDAGNVSDPSPPLAGRAHDQGLPEVPVPTLAWVEESGTTLAQLEWTSDHEVRVQRRPSIGGTWVDVTSWRAPGAISFRDPSSDPTRAYEYRLWARKYTGALMKGQPLALAAQ